MSSFVHFAASTPGLVNLFFPMFRSEAMGPVIKDLETNIDDEKFAGIKASFDSIKLSSIHMLKGDDVVTKVKKALVNLLLMGFGEVIFGGLDGLQQLAEVGVEIGAALTKSTLARIVYISSFIFEHEKTHALSTVWTDLEEVLTILGIVPFCIDGRVFYLMDRHNEEIFVLRQDELADRSYDSKFRFHAFDVTENGAVVMTKRMDFFDVFKVKVSESGLKLDPNKVFRPTGIRFPIYQERDNVRMRDSTDECVDFLVQSFRGDCAWFYEHIPILTDLLEKTE
jgi:hypothetical protein